jgi:hypothetical protein
VLNLLIDLFKNRMMMIKKLSVLKISITFLTLLVCQACNPYTARRVPLENSPYVACKNCKANKKNTEPQKDASSKYDFLSDEEKKQIQPLPIKRKNQKKKHQARRRVFHKHKTKSSRDYMKPKKRKTNGSYGAVKEQNLNTKVNKKSSKRNSYVPLSATPQKKYSTDQQQKMLADKKEDMQKLSNKSNQVVTPVAKAPTLEKEKMQIKPTQQGETQLNNKLQDLQKMVKKSASNSQPAQTIQEKSIIPAPQKLPQSTPVVSLPLEKPAPQQLPKSPPVVSTQFEKPVPQPSAANMDQVPLDSYDIKNKPIPLPH